MKPLPESTCRADEELVGVTEREKRLLAKQLHEGVLQSLSAASILVRVVAKRTQLPQAEPVPEFLRLQETIDDAIDEARFLIRQLQPPGQDTNALLAALQELADSVRTKCCCRLHYEPGKDTPLDAKTSLALVRVAQEATRAALQRPKVSKISLVLMGSGARVRLKIEDDGKISSGRRAQQDERTTLLMTSHAKLAGGELKIRRWQGGTAVTFDCGPQGAAEKPFGARSRLAAARRVID